MRSSLCTREKMIAKFTFFSSLLAFASDDNVAKITSDFESRGMTRGCVTREAIPLYPLPRASWLVSRESPDVQHEFRASIRSGPPL